MRKRIVPLFCVAALVVVLLVIINPPNEVDHNETLAAVFKERLEKAGVEELKVSVQPGGGVLIEMPGMDAAEAARITDALEQQDS